MMKIKVFSFIFFCFSLSNLFSQNNALVLNGGYVVMNGGTSSTPAYLVVNQNSTLGIARTGGHIISEGDYNFVKWNAGSSNGSYVYPFGYSTTDYLPFTFNKTSGDANIVVSTYGTSNPNTPLANGVTNMFSSGPASDASDFVVDRWWRLQMENGVSAPAADLTFSYRGSENTIAGISCPVDVIGAQYWNGTNWIGPAFAPGNNCTTSGVGTSQANGVGVFTTNSSQPFVLVKMTKILPVELLRFSSECENKNVIVKWTTATEQNNDYFTVERSADGINFLPVGIVNGAGNSSTVKNYSFTDSDPLSGTSYYQLKQTDFNGLTQTFPASTMSSCRIASGVSVSFGPNPVIDGNIWVSISGAENKNVQVTLTDVLGKNIFSKDITEKASSYSFNTKVQTAAGIYFLNVITSEKVFSNKIVVLK